MGIFSTSSPFDQDVERATSETKTNEDWGLMMEICDRAGASASAAKDCLRAVLRRLGHPDPHVQVHAATLLAACVANCGRLFHLEVASRDFETEFRRLVSRAQPPVQRRLRAMLRDWAEGEFRDDPQLDLIPSLHAKLRAEAGESGAPTSAPALAPTPATQLSAVQREQEDLARAIALSLREAAPAPTATPATSTAASLYPRVESNEGSALAAVPAPAPAPRKVRALYDFEAAEDNELTFYAGETVYVTDSSDPNWWKGHNERGEGLFPANFVSGEAEAEVGAAPAAAAANELMAEVEADEAPPTSIDEATMDEALALLHEADPGAPAGPEEARLVRLEARAHAMGALVDAALERADRRHARLTQLSADLVDALNLYHTLMRDPHPQPHPQPHPPPPPPPTMGGFAPHPPRPLHAFPAQPPPQPRC